MENMKSNLSCCVFLQYVTQTVESADSQKALAEMQMKNGALQEQLAVQRQLLRELETQLHESQRTCAQLRTQVTSTGSFFSFTLWFCLKGCFSLQFTCTQTQGRKIGSQFLVFNHEILLKSELIYIPADHDHV